MPPKPTVVVMAEEPTAGAWQTALTQHSLTVAVVNRRGLAEALLRKPEAVLLDARLFSGLADLQAALLNAHTAIYAMLPAAAGDGERVAVSRLPNVKGVYGPATPVTDIARVIAAQILPIKAQVEPERTTTTAPVLTSLPEARPLKRQIRLGFYGAHGGVGVSTTALKVAQLIAARGLRVALFDATGRGDLHILLGAEPVPDAPLISGNLSVFLGLPQEDAVNGYEAIVIDGGRQTGAFNTAWIRLDQRPSDQQVARWAGDEESASARSLQVSLPRLPKLSFEVTA